mmetsp:Transcript_51055/g.165235  ORF Transcript_51055/g.165235 Transcript_51055/m.165235 type:complete len:433 (+) Transcript_51055:188-1486(+)
MQAPHSVAGPPATLGLSRLGGVTEGGAAEARSYGRGRPQLPPALGVAALPLRLHPPEPLQRTQPLLPIDVAEPLAAASLTWRAWRMSSTRGCIGALLLVVAPIMLCCTVDLRLAWHAHGWGWSQNLEPVGGAEMPKSFDSSERSLQLALDARAAVQPGLQESADLPLLSNEIVREVFSLAEGLAWVRGLDSERPSLADQDHSIAARSISADEYRRNGAESPGGLAAIVFSDALGPELSTGPAFEHVPAQFQWRPTPKARIAKPAAKKAPQVSAEELAARKVRLRMQVQALQEQGYAVLMAPPGESRRGFGVLHPIMREAADSHIEQLGSSDDALGYDMAKHALEALLSSAGVHPSRASVVAAHLAEQGVSAAADVRAARPEQLAAVFSAPGLGLAAGERLRALSGLVRQSMESSFGAAALIFGSNGGLSMDM